ncbi:MAG: cobalamin biosynthesis protein [Rhizobiaceae bacterium]|nr:cobalamin biosynthesis protein [Rhizobiaceae bacterium]
MMVAGIGCRKGSSGAAVFEAIGRALAAHGLTPSMLDRLATGQIKRGEAGIAAAADMLKLPLVIVENDALSAVSARCLTHSRKSLEATGADSLSEAAALAAAGEGGALLGPRIARNGVTCAIAHSEGDA